MRGIVDDRYVEKLERLDGSRANAPLEEAAVRLGDLKELLRVTEMKSADIGAAPTASDYNALRADVRKISEALNALSLVIANRLRR